MERLQPLVGLAADRRDRRRRWSTNRRAISLRTVAWGFGLQFLFAVIVLKTGVGQAAFQVLGDQIRQLLDYSDGRAPRSSSGRSAIAPSGATS